MADGRATPAANVCALGDAVAEAVALIREPATIRARCRAVLASVDAGVSPHFAIDRVRLADVAARVAALTRSRFPDLSAIPYHSRWRHFEAGGVDRKAMLDARLAGRDAADVARTRIDLALVSVLLDAGAGADWSFRDDDGRTYRRSEGLAVASFRAFVGGRFSSDARDPLRVDARALRRVDATLLADVFQVARDNPLVGLDGRADLLRRLGAALAHDDSRPGDLFGIVPRAADGAVSAAAILRALLDAYSAIWPSGQRLEGEAIGDVWPHPHAGGTGLSAGLVPFHKLSQWLAYSLLEPFEWAGVTLRDIDALTGLPEYRNGGLLLDAGVLVPRDPSTLARPMTPDDPWIVEWRAATVALLDDLAPLVRDALGANEGALPLARILEGGTWAAGRAIAAERRVGGAPPVTVVSDGTVF